MFNKVLVKLWIFGFLYSTISINNLNAQEPSKNDRFVKAVIQLMSSFSIKRGLEEDPICKQKNYKDFSVEEVVASMPDSAFKNEGDREAMRKQIEKFKTVVDVVEADGRPMWKKMYEQTIVSYKAGGVIPNTRDGHCDVMYQAASNIFLNAKNNFKLMEK
ncbi:MAG: hypothetical protein EBV34_16435 [Betaproteobacteria bacterium]|nr:hypothetical protein [Betaproteobacteria bacterium]